HQQRHPVGAAEQRRQHSGHAARLRPGEPRQRVLDERSGRHTRPAGSVAEVHAPAGGERPRVRGLAGQAARVRPPALARGTSPYADGVSAASSGTYNTVVIAIMSGTPRRRRSKSTGMKPMKHVTMHKPSIAVRITAVKNRGGSPRRSITRSPIARWPTV